ncbi:MAG: ribosome maturation factor RimP [Elusimicrobiota bacterium]|nr:ribosome maturation factor RimP [Elusimicrobiota bacterium]
MSITNELTDIVGKVVRENGYEFVELKYGKRGNRWFLQVFADKEGGITLADCKLLSEKLGYELDRHEDLLKHAYSLEVSSPGLDRPLKNEADFKRYKGKDVNIRLFSPVAEQREWTGKIVKSEDGKIFITDTKEGENQSFDIENIASAKLEININEI